MIIRYLITMKKKDGFKSDDRSLINSNMMDYKNEFTENDTTYSFNDSHMFYDFPSNSKTTKDYKVINSRIDDSIMADMKNCLNPLKNTFLVDLLPPGKRFRINEDHIYFKNNERMENIPEALDVNKKYYHIIQNKAEYYDNDSLSEFSYTSSNSSINNKKEK